jgi:2,4-dienoyl-CoA reductase (NADPH2)
MYPRLFEPLELGGGITLPNRILMGSMHTGFEARNAFAELAAFYAERARGGAALLVTGGFSPNHAGNLSAHRAQFSTSQDAAGHRVITGAVHAAGGRIVLQLLHSGRYGLHKDIVAPSPTKAPINAHTPREMTHDDVLQTIEDFVSAAGLAREAGYDGVEIMGSEGYLITQFLAPRTNQRSDAWGGPLAQRMRFATEIVSRVRAATDARFIIVYRISALDLVEGGLSTQDIQQVARAVEAAGASLLNTGIGWHEARIPTIAQAVPRGAFSWSTRALKEAVRIPVVASNRINAPEVAEAILERGEADMVSLARALLSDPEFAAKAKRGDRAGINICIACNQACLDHYFIGEPVSCVVNPRAGRETRLVLKPAERKKAIAVVGGGPAGLICASTAAERGHRVTLFERAAELGGQFNLAKRVPGKQEFGESVAYYAERLKRAGVDVRLSHSPSENELRTFDEVVVATGIDPRRPQIEGIDHPKVVSYVDVLAGRVAPGKDVVILGMGGIGFDVALFLVGAREATLERPAFEAHWGITEAAAVPGNLIAGRESEARHRITMLKRSTTPFGHTLGRTTGWVHRAELARHGVRMLKGVEYRRIDDAGVHIVVEGRETVIPADTVVLCAGQLSRREIPGTHVASSTRSGPCAKAPSWLRASSGAGSSDTGRRLRACRPRRAPA